MKLIQTDTQAPSTKADGPLPARPEHRSVQVSLCLTLLVLVVTVATVYLVVPERHNELMTAALEVHRTPPTFALKAPSRSELNTWGVEEVGKSVPWPKYRPDLHIIGVHPLSILRRPATAVRYRLGDITFSFVVQRARDAPPRRHKRLDGDDAVVSFRKGRWTCVGVGPADKITEWKSAIGAP